MSRQTATVLTVISVLVALCPLRACCGFGFASATPTPASTCPILGPAPAGAIAPENVGQLTEIRRLETRPEEYVVRLAFSPDGSVLASAHLDAPERLWQVKDGALLHTLPGAAWSLAFDPAGEVLATGSGDGTIRLWRVSDGTLLRSWQGHSDNVVALAFSPDGSLLASGGRDGLVRLWRADDGTPLFTLEWPSDRAGGEVQNLAFSPDGSLLATSKVAARWKAVFLWRVEDGALLRSLESPRVVVRSIRGEEGVEPVWFASTSHLAFDPEGTMLAVAGVVGVVMWSVPDGALLCAVGYDELPFGAALATAFNPDWSLVATGGDDYGLVWLRRVSTGAVLRTLDAPSGVTVLAFSPDGSLLAVGLEDGTVRLWGVQP